MADHKWDYYVNLGDFLDYYTISQFNKEKPGLIEGKTIMNELNIGEKIIGRHSKLLQETNPKVKMYLLEGNHEYRATDFVHRYPHLKGLIEPENALKLKEKKIKYLKSWSEDENLVIGNAKFAHGRYVNQHHSKKMVEAYGSNIFYGHVHDTNSFNKTNLGSKEALIGQSLGCLCEYPTDVDYTKGAPKNWQQAFTVFHFMPDGSFNYFIVRIQDGKFISPEGKLYK